MFAFVRRILRLTPSTVDGALNSVTKSLAHLKVVADAKAAVIDLHTEVIAASRDARAAAQLEHERATRVHAAISELVA